MKLLLASVLAAAVGWLGYTGGTCPIEDCCPLEEECVVVDVECLPDGRCRIECEGPDGETCSLVVDCDELGGCKGGPCCK